VSNIFFNFLKGYEGQLFFNHILQPMEESPPRSHQVQRLDPKTRLGPTPNKPYGPGMIPTAQTSQGSYRQRSDGPAYEKPYPSRVPYDEPQHRFEQRTSAVREPISVPTPHMQDSVGRLPPPVSEILHEASKVVPVKDPRDVEGCEVILEKSEILTR